MKKYNQYKKSDVEWLKEIPENWKVESFKNILVERNEKNNPIKSKEILSLSIDKGVTLYSEKTTNLDRFKDDFTQYKLAHIGDLVFNSMNMIVGAVGVSNFFGCVSPVYYTYYGRLNNSYTTKFYEYLFRCKTVQRVLYSLGKGLVAIDRGDGKYNTLRLKVSRDDLRSMKLPYPDLSEQKEIVKFLDDKTTKIDQAIAIKQKQIELLKERTQILIHNAVTRGLNDTVKLKDSGVEWIGEIPEHWEMKKLKYVLNIKNGSDYKHIQTNVGYPVIGSGGQFAYASEFMHDGEVVFLGRKGTIDKPLYFNGKFWAVDTMFYAISKNGNNTRYLYFVATTIPFKFYSTATALPSMTQSDLNNHTIALPSKEEQKEIVLYIENISLKIDTAISLKEQEIEKLKEYKISLIDGVVTGKVKVN